MGRLCRGFTLIELMVVIVLIGVLLGMVSLAGGKSPARQARQEASVLIAQIHRLRELAVAEGREYGLKVEENGYQAYRFNPPHWLPTGAGQRLPSELLWRLEVSGQPAQLGRRFEQPQILLLSSDESSAFVLYFEDAEGPLLSLSSDGFGDPEIHEN